MKDFAYTGNRVLVRVDFNVPLDGAFNVTDDTRIRGALPTITHLVSKGAKVILMSHLGRPQKKKLPDGSLDREKFSLKHVIPTLSKLLEKDVQFVEDTIGETVKDKIDQMQNGDVLLLENTRFYPEEKKGDSDMAASLASLGDIYVNDAFGSAHRAHVSTTTVAAHFDDDHKSFGFLMEKELANADRILNKSEQPFVAIVGGAKVSDKIMLLEALMQKVDHLIVGGGMAYTFIKAQGGEIGNSLVELDKVDLAKELLAKADETQTKIYLPADSKIADAFSNEANSETTASNAIKEGWMGLDIGTAAIAEFSDVIESANTILWNGPMGVFEMESFAAGTKAVAEAVAKSTSSGAFSLVGGGDSVAAINLMGLQDKVSYVSTGGGAMLELLEGKTLPGVAAIES